MRIINRKQSRMQKYIYESANWPNFVWNTSFVTDKLLAVNRERVDYSV